eukprot:1193851-Prorocentrum_minimum.AAC.2
MVCMCLVVRVDTMCCRSHSSSPMCRSQSSRRERRRQNASILVTSSPPVGVVAAAGGGLEAFVKFVLMLSCRCFWSNFWSLPSEEVTSAVPFLQWASSEKRRSYSCCLESWGNRGLVEKVPSPLLQASTMDTLRTSLLLIGLMSSRSPLMHGDTSSSDNNPNSMSLSRALSTGEPKPNSGTAAVRTAAGERKVIVGRQGQSICGRHRSTRSYAVAPTHYSVRALAL